MKSYFPKLNFSTELLTFWGRWYIGMLYFHHRDEARSRHNSRNTENDTRETNSGYILLQIKSAFRPFAFAIPRVRCPDKSSLRYVAINIAPLQHFACHPRLARSAKCLTACPNEILAGACLIPRPSASRHVAFLFHFDKSHSAGREAVRDTKCCHVIGNPRISRDYLSCRQWSAMDCEENVDVLNSMWINIRVVVNKLRLIARMSNRKSLVEILELYLWSQVSNICIF